MYLPDPRDLSLSDVELINTLRGFRSVVDGIIRGDLLTGVGLSLFHHAPTNSHWIGKHDPRVSDHDRWYFVRKPKKGHTGEAIWWHVFPERQYTPGRLGEIPARSHPRTVLLTKDLKRELERLHTHVDTINNVRLLRPHGAEVSALSGAEVLTRIRLFGPIEKGPYFQDGPNPLYDLDPLQAPGVLHELIYHYPAWAAANEATGMPQELTLRMHGYAHILPYLPMLLSRP